MRTRSAKTKVAIAAVAVTLAAALPIAQAAPTHGPQPGLSPNALTEKKVTPNQRGIYWGAWIGSQLTGGQPPWDMSAVSHFEGMVGKGLSLLEFAAPFVDCESSSCAFYGFPTYEMQTIRNYGAIPFFSWGSQSMPVPASLEQPAFQLADIASGAYDAYIREFAAGAKDWGHPFFLRFNWEMNGDWFPWAENVNGNRPGDYVAAWRHVHDIFTQAGATNATWVWCPYANPKSALGPLAPHYPGAAYVDWTCLDGFNWGKNKLNPRPWKSFDKIFGPSYHAIVDGLAPGKPMLIGEMGSGGNARAKATWIDQMFKVLRGKYRHIRGLIWFEQVDRGVTWPIETAPSVTEAFSRGIRQRAFKPNAYSALSGSKVAPPR
jgi:hypothetical protein